MALSNTAVVSETDETGGMKAVKFAETRPLPSYLVAFAVGPFEAVDAGKIGKKQTPLRIIATHRRSGEAKYAAEVTGPILASLEDYFGIPYPYEKLDSIAVPLFFGAMENPGLITYGQTLILSKPEQDGVERQRNYADTAAHEMAHMWFGDLVTTAWWDDIWLNEEVRGRLRQGLESCRFVKYSKRRTCRLLCGRAEGGAECVFHGFPIKYFCYRLFWEMQPLARKGRLRAL